MHSNLISRVNTVDELLRKQNIVMPAQSKPNTAPGGKRPNFSTYKNI